MSTNLCRASRRLGLVGAALVVLAMTPTAAAAQLAWDAAAFGGFLATRSPVPANESSYENWFYTGQYGVTAGRHVTRHMKVEFEASGSGTARQYFFRYVTVPWSAAPYPIYGEARATVRAASAQATWQFFDNQWVHPFLTAGVTAHVQTRSLNLRQQPIYVGDPRAPSTTVVIAEQHEGPDTSVTWRPVIGGGAKVYVSSRAFVRADARAMLGSEPRAVAFRAGAGFDF